MRFFLTFIMLFFSKRSTVFLKFALLVKENQILKAQIRQHSRRIHVSPADRHFFTLLLSLYQRHENSLPSSPPTPSFYSWKKLCKHRWSYPHRTRPGRPPSSASIRNLIIEIKKDNPLWGYLSHGFSFLLRLFLCRYHLPQAHLCILHHANKNDRSLWHYRSSLHGIHP